MNSENDEKSITIGIVKNLPHWFAILIALAYATGFLCIFTFLDRFGIHENREDFLKVRYIHVGILFLLFPITILAPFALTLSLKRIEIKENKNENGVANTETDKTKKRFRVPVSGIVLFLNMLCTFYLFVLFTPRDFAFSKAPIFPLIFISSLAGPYLIDLLVEKIIVAHLSEIITIVLRWFLVAIVVIVMDFFSFQGFGLKLWAIFWGQHWYPDGGIYYLIFMILIPITLWLTNERAKAAPNKRSRQEMFLSAISVIIMFYFLGILAFAYRVYPLIPVAKGGGNYVESPRVVIHFRPVPGVFPIVEATSPVESALSESNSFVIIDQSPDSLFLANTTDSGGPVKWEEMRYVPNIIEVQRESIAQIIYTQVSLTNGDALEE